MYIFESNLFYSAKYSNQNKAVVGRNDTLTGIRFILVPFLVSSETGCILKLIQLTMYYSWDQENQQTHRINKFYAACTQDNNNTE